MSAKSLQELSGLFSKLSGMISAQMQRTGKPPMIIIESTDFVSLEQFVRMSLQMDKASAKQVAVLSVMSDYDIRIVAKNSFRVKKGRKESELVYVGKSGLSLIHI